MSVSKTRNVVVFVDDDVYGTKMYKDAIQEAGYSVVSFTNGDSALEWIEQDANRSAIFIVVLDIMMPYGKRFGRGESNDGLETGRLVLEYLLKEFPKLDVMLLSINGFEGLRREFRERGVLFRLKQDTLPSELVAEIQGIRKGRLA